MEQCCFVMAFDDYIINLYLYIPTNFLDKDFIHQALVRCHNILEIEWHLPVAEGATICVKGCLLLICHLYLDLMIALAYIDEALKLKSFQGFNI